MSQSNIARFPNSPSSHIENNPDAASQARQRIASLPDTYLDHAAPKKEDLVGAVTPVSPAAESVSDHYKDAMPREKAKSIPEPKPMPKPKPESTSNHSSRIPAQLKPLVAAAVTFGLLFLLFKAPIFLSQVGYLTQGKPATTSQPNQPGGVVSSNPTISIPKINVNAPLVFASTNVEAAIQKDLEGGVVHYANTAKPGENGNSVLFGHSSNDWWEPGNYKFVFVLLDKLQVGDTFSVNYNSKQYIYQVAETKVVEPTDISVLSQTPDPQMTIITCTPPGTSWKRLIVRAKQISPAPGANAAVTPQGTQQTAQALPDNAPGITTMLNNWWEAAKAALGFSK